MYVKKPAQNLQNNRAFQMTEAQMKAALKLIRNVCQPKNKATDGQ